MGARKKGGRIMLNKENIRNLTPVLRDMMTATQTTGHEVAVYLDDQNSVVARFKGDNFGVSMDWIPGTIGSVHTHPIDFTFSNVDIGTALQEGFEYMAVLRPSGVIDILDFRECNLWVPFPLLSKVIVDKKIIQVLSVLNIEPELLNTDAYLREVVVTTFCSLCDIKFIKIHPEEWR
jgi:hypothetical protein